MKKNFAIILLMFFMGLGFSENLHKFKLNDKYGYFDDSMKVRVPAMYKDIYEVSDKYFIIIEGEGRFSYETLVDRNMNPVDPELTKKDSISAINDHFFCIDRNIFYNRNTGLKVSYYNPVLNFQTSDATVYIGVSTPNPKNRNENYMYIDSEGNPYEKAGKWFKVNGLTEGGSALVETFEAFYIIDSDGNILRNDIQTSDTEFHEGLMPIRTKSGESGYINEKGKFVFHCEFYKNPDVFELYYPFSGGYALVERDENDWYVYDKKGNCKRFGVGYKLSPYLNLYFSDGLISARKENGNGKYGFLNTDGKEAIDFIYDSVDEFNNGYALCVKNGIDGILDTKGNFIASKDLK